MANTEEALVTVTVEFPQDQVQRVDAYRDREAARTRFKVSRASAFRAVVERGLADIERKRGGA